MGHKIPYLSSLLVTCHQSSRLNGVVTTIHLICHHSAQPAIVHLVERRTVVVNKLLSLGHWFESGSRDSFKIVYVSYFSTSGKLYKIHEASG